MFVGTVVKFLPEIHTTRIAELPSSSALNFPPTGGLNNTSAPLTPKDPISSLGHLLWQLRRSIGAGGASLLRAMTSEAASSGAFVSPAASPPVTPLALRRQDTSQSLLERRHQLEAELASLPPAYTSSVDVPILDQSEGAVPH